VATIPRPSCAGQLGAGARRGLASAAARTPAPRRGLAHRVAISGIASQLWPFSNRRRTGAATRRGGGERRRCARRHRLGSSRPARRSQHAAAAHRPAERTWRRWIAARFRSGPKARRRTSAPTSFHPCSCDRHCILSGRHGGGAGRTRRRDRHETDFAAEVGARADAPIVIDTRAPPGHACSSCSPVSPCTRKCVSMTRASSARSTGLAR
jgi:hypothetical protein